MVRLCMVSALVLMASAFGLVAARYEARLLFVQLDRLDDRTRELEIDWRRLQVERAEYARRARIDAVARQDLGLRPVRPDDTLYLDGTRLQSGGVR